MLRVILILAFLPAAIGTLIGIFAIVVMAILALMNAVLH